MRKENQKLNELFAFFLIARNNANMQINNKAFNMKISKNHWDFFDFSMVWSPHASGLIQKNF